MVSNAGKTARAAVDIGDAGDAALIAKRFGGLAQQVSNGRSSYTLPLAVSRNAFYESFVVTLAAGPAAWSPAGKVAAVRAQDVTLTLDGSTASGTAVVVDFGTPRTVSQVALAKGAPSDLKIFSVRVWAGVGFADPPIVDAHAKPVAQVQFSEVQTLRLEVQVTGRPGEDALGSLLLIWLPEAPADFELRIDDAPPVWTFKGTLPPEGGGIWSDPSDSTDGLSTTTVELATALNAMAGDPTAASDEDVVNHQLVFAARVPGVLSIQPPGAPEVLHLTLLPAGKQTLAFDAEGQQTVPLALPSWAAALAGVRLTAAAKLPPERTLPPVGPVRDDLADLILDPDHAAAVRLTDQTLAELTALRLQLTALDDGAEASVVLVSPATDGGPGDPLPGAVSKPVVLAPGAGGGDGWTTFAFPKPVALINEGAPRPLPWAKVLVSRGQVTWTVTGDVTLGETRQGPPDGPWLPLPALEVASDAGQPPRRLDQMRGRLRQIGHAAVGTPIAPLSLAIQGAPQQPAPAPTGTADVTPTPKGQPLEVRCLPVAPAADRTAPLAVTARVGGTVTLDQVVLMVTT